MYYLNQSETRIVLCQPIIGKLDLYVAAGGFHPKRVLPCVIDVGTNNIKLKNDPRYLGDREDRLEGDEYYSLIDEFMAAVKLRWPRALIQFEDFQSKHAVKLLARLVFLLTSKFRFRDSMVSGFVWS